MISTKEEIFLIGTIVTSRRSQRAAHLTGSLAENLQDGDYVISSHPKVVFFIRVDEWTKDMEIERIDFENEYTITLSSGRIIQLYPNQVDATIENRSSFRIVLVSNQDSSSFKVDLDQIDHLINYLSC